MLYRNLKGDVPVPLMRVLPELNQVDRIITSILIICYPTYALKDMLLEVGNLMRKKYAVLSVTITDSRTAVQY